MHLELPALSISIFRTHPIGIGTIEIVIRMLPRSVPDCNVPPKHTAGFLSDAERMKPEWVQSTYGYDYENRTFRATLD